MVQNISAEEKAANASNNLVLTRMILFALPSGNYGFWFGKGSFTWNGVTWVGSDRLIEIEDNSETIGLGANGKTIRLRENVGLGLTSSILSTIHNESYLRRQVMIWEASFDNTTGNISGLPSLKWTGLLRPVKTKGRDGNRWIEADCEHQNFDNSRRNFTMANNAHHQGIAPADKFFEFCGAAGASAIYFGTATPPSWNFQTNRQPQ